MEKKKELNPIKERELDQVAGGLISPVEILQDRLIVGNMSCYNSGAFVGPEFEQDHKKSDLTGKKTRCKFVLNDPPKGA